MREEEGHTTRMLATLTESSKSSCKRREQPFLTTFLTTLQHPSNSSPPEARSKTGSTLCPPCLSVVSADPTSANVLTAGMSLYTKHKHQLHSDVRSLAYSSGPPDPLHNSWTESWVRWGQSSKKETQSGSGSRAQWHLPQPSLHTEGSNWFSPWKSPQPGGRKTLANHLLLDRPRGLLQAAEALPPSAQRAAASLVLQSHQMCRTESP